MSQNVVTHTAGTITSFEVGSTTAVGSSTLSFSNISASGTVVVGDVFTIAGDNQTYVSKSALTIVSTTDQDVTISPPLKVIASATSALTLKATHVVNLAFHRNAFVYVTRPMLTNKIEGAGLMARSLTDSLSGITLRLELIRQRKQTAWEFDVLYGAKLVRPELATRIAG